MNLQEGLKFYSDLAGHLNELRDACKQVRRRFCSPLLPSRVY